MVVGRRKKRRRRTGAEPELPRNVREAFEIGAGLFAELREGRPIEEAITRRRLELRDLMAPFDAVHLLGHIVFSEAPIDPETYKESEHPGAAFVVEMVAADLLVRPGRAGTAEITPAIDARVSDPVRRLCREAVHLESLRRMRVAGGLSTPASSSRARAASHHLMLRGAGWPWQEHETLHGLFGAERFAVRLREALAFDVEDAIACSEALPRLVLGRLEAHMMDARESAVDFGEEHPAYRWATASLQGWQEAGPEHIRALAITALWALNRVGDVLLLDNL